MHLAHAGVVDDDAAAREEDELAPRGRVAPGSVGAECARRETRVVADEGVDERRLPDPGRAEQHARDTRAEEPADGVEPDPRPGRHDVDRYLAAHVGDGSRDRVRIVLEIRLREYHDRTRAALDRER